MDIDANDIVDIWKDKGGDNAGQFDAAGSFTVARGDYEGALLKDGVTDYVFEFVATDIAGNEGPKETRSGVTLDLKDIGFTHKFPIMDGTDDDLRTLGAASANVSVELNKDADTLAVIYKHLGPGDADVSKNDTLTIGGDGLAKDTFTELSVTGLEDGRMYYVRIDARDAAGNWTQAGPDTFTFDEDHELVPAASFDLEIAVQDGKSDQFKLRGFKDDNKDKLDDDKMRMIGGRQDGLPVPRGSHPYGNGWSGRRPRREEQPRRFPAGRRRQRHQPGRRWLGFGRNAEGGHPRHRFGR